MLIPPDERLSTQAVIHGVNLLPGFPMLTSAAFIGIAICS